ncbi:MAG: GNAT family N-acetyltransferase [Planctomycetota bacterium]|nr:GNAT family N-acetyltransferase [Planctomycetota bacterium]
MEIRAERLLLREFTESDLDALHAYHSDPRYGEFYVPEELTAEHTRKLLNLFLGWAEEDPRRGCQVAITLADELIGTCGVRKSVWDGTDAEFGIELNPEHWGQGYAEEAARAILGRGFTELGVAIMRGQSVSRNEGAARLVRKLGFVSIGMRKGPPWMQSRGWQVQDWELARAAWSG